MRNISDEFNPFPPQQHHKHLKHWKQCSRNRHRQFTFRVAATMSAYDPVNTTERDWIQALEYAQAALVRYV